ncbi:MAG: hypothetical protein RLY71_2095 [Pseudomonadota bacterium]|jgi:hydroxyethylthiazole kinase-like uncharacterized protein yjeF
MQPTTSTPPPESVPQPGPAGASRRPRPWQPAIDRHQPAWPLHATPAARALEAHAAAQLPPHTLMQRAGLAVARLALALAPHARTVWILAGPGNNGGDGFEAALHLARAGKLVRLTWLGSADRLPPDAAASLARARAAGIEPTTTLAAPPLDHDDLIIDALLGRGLTRPAGGPLAEAIRLANQQPAPRLAVDLPSGLPADSGALAHDAPCVQARWTLALLSVAPGLFTADGRDHAGSVWWDDLGVAVTAQAPAAWLGSPGAWIDAWPPRRHARHKGSFGDVWVVGGARSMGGAALLAGRAALHAGAGRVYVHRLDPAADALDPLHPELMLAELPPSTPADPLAQATVVAGCGGGQAIRAALPALLARAGRLLLDADALNAVAADAALQQTLQARRCRGLASVLTPHPLEAARLLGSTVGAVQADRLAAAQQLADRFGAVIVLKGSGSVLAAPAQTAWINPSGNAALATPGSGDVLAGWLGGLWSQLPRDGNPAAAASEAAAAWLATRAATWSHGRAAELASPQAEALPAGALAECLRGFGPAGPLG